MECATVRLRAAVVLLLAATSLAQTTQPAFEGSGENAADGAERAHRDRVRMVDGPVGAHPVEEGSWLDRAKHPAPWWEWGFDIRLREVFLENPITLNHADPTHEIHWQRQRFRWYNRFTPADDMEINLRMAWEGKHFDKPKSFDNWQPTSAVFDQLNIKWNRIGDSPFSIHAGRQDLMLGDRWLVLDGTPLDGSSTIYFDAIRLITAFEPIDTTLDLIYLENAADQSSWFQPVYDHHQFGAEQNETGVIAWLTNKSLPNTQLDGYYIYKQNRAVLAAGYEGEIHTFGLRGGYDFTDRLRVYGNLAGQFGRRNGADVCALGSLNRLTWTLKDPWKSTLRMDYEYLSGDDPDTGTDEAFDLLWGRWPRFSELYIYTAIGETGRIGDISNMHRVGWGWTGHPVKKMEICADYHLLFADQNTLKAGAGFSESGCFRGQLITSVLRYKFTRWLSGHLVGEVLFPGDYYSDVRNDPATFCRAELVFSW